MYSSNTTLYSTLGDIERSNSRSVILNAYISDRNRGRGYITAEH